MALKRIWVQLGLNNPYNRELLKGIAQYAGQRPEWELLVQAWYELHSAEAAQALNLDGIIVKDFAPNDLKPLRTLQVPVVNCSSSVLPDWPQVACDDRAIGRMAAAHLRERGFKHFAYRGDLRFEPGILRKEGFLEALSEQGFTGLHLSPDPHNNLAWQDDLDEIRGFLRELPQPLGVFTETAFIGRRVLQAAQGLGLRVPAQVALVCGFDDELTCVISKPQLSAIRLPADRVGFEAACVLDHWIHGQTSVANSRLIQPLDVIVRQSSDHLAIEEPDLAEAVRFIREQACTGINVEDVVKAVSVSRRWLEQRFRKAFGCTPGEEIRKLQVLRARQLLTNTDWSMEAIARASGYRSAMRLSANFKQRTGESPTDFRRRSSPG